MARQRYLGVRGAPENSTGPLVSTSTLKAGDFVIWDTTNGLQIAASAAANAAGISANDNRMYGRANEDALDVNGVVKSRLSCTKYTPWVNFELWLYHSTAASAVATPLSQLGVVYELRYQSAALGWAVDIEATTNNFCLVCDYIVGRKSTEGLPTWPDATTAGTNQYPNVWVAGILASAAMVR